MKIFLAVGDTKPYWKLLREENVKNILVSYAYFKSPEKYIEASGGYWPDTLILDSGAFSVWTKGDIIDIDKYAQFCKDMRAAAPITTHLTYVNLDVLPGKFGEMPTAQGRIDSAKAGMVNCKYLQSLGVDVIPVFHQHEPLEFLVEMMKEFPYFGISPANDVHVNDKVKWLKTVFNIVKADAKTHGFGATSPQIIKQFPFYSADSSSWTAGSRFARIPNFTNGSGGSVQFKDKEDFLSNWDNLHIKDTTLLTDYLIRARAGIKSFQEMERFVTDLWTSRNIIWPTK